MIELKDLTKSFRIRGCRKFVARDVSAIFPERTCVALLGRNGTGKSTLLKIIGGTMRPDYGEVVSTGSISWQIGFAGSFHPDLTGAQNTRFISRVYGIDTEGLEEYVLDFSELGDSFWMPVRTYSSGMRARLAFGVTMGIPFSYYLIDEVTSVGDASFKEKCRLVLEDRLDQAGSIVVSHSESVLKTLCSSGAVLEDGRLFYYEALEDALAHHAENMNVAAA
ncbi:MAG: ABC transporter ATP-binding protein [Pseudomonadota bacterium]